MPAAAAGASTSASTRRNSSTAREEEHPHQTNMEGTSGNRSHRLTLLQREQQRGGEEGGGPNHQNADTTNNTSTATVLFNSQEATSSSSSSSLLMLANNKKEGGKETKHNAHRGSSLSSQKQVNSSRIDHQEISNNNNNEEEEDSSSLWDYPRRNQPQHPQQQKRSLWNSFQQLRQISGAFVNQDRIQFFIVSLIAINALMMGIGTFDFVTDNPTVYMAFELTDMIFLIIFTIELSMQFLYHGYRLLLDGWLVFDLIVIVMSWSFASVQIIRAFRIFRALRLITRIKVMKNLVLALFSVIPRMFAIGLLLFLVSYIFAVMCTQLFANLHPTYTPDVDYWGRLDATFFTLFQIMTLDNWADITRETMVAYPYAWLPIIVFVIVTGFVVVNLIIAVICDAISALHDDDKAKLHGNFRDTSTSADSNGSTNDDNESIHPALEQDVREQLSALETHVEELTKMQEETMLTLQMLTASIAEHRQQRQQRNKKKKKQQQQKRSSSKPQPSQSSMSSSSFRPSSSLVDLVN